MTRYFTHIGSRTYDVTVARVGGGAPAVTVDGAPAALDFHEVARGAVYSLILDGHSYELWVRPGGEGGGFVVFVAGHTMAVRVEDERQRRSRELRLAAPGRAAAGTAEIKAPMPALVLAVMVAPGDAVTAGQGLCVLEAMKMENLMRSPRAGVVRDVRIQEGRGVALNDVLMVIGDAP